MKKLFLILCLLGSFAGSVFASGKLTGVSPNHAKVGTSLTVSLSGQSVFFSTGTTTVWLSQGTNTILDASNVSYKNSDSLSADFSISSGAQTGIYDVNVYNSSSGTTARIAKGFSITATSNPSLTTISPSSAKQSQSLSVSISGQNTNFTSGTCTVWFSQGTTTYIRPSSVTVNNDNSVSASFSIPYYATPGNYDVTVADASDGYVTTPGGFTINAVHTLGGMITTSTGSPLASSWVYALKVNTSDSTVMATDSTKTDAYGNYYFGDINNSSPYMYVMPDSVSYPAELPTYFDTTAYLMNGTQITLYGRTDSLSFSTIAGSNPGGSGFIGGKISYCTICKKAGPVENLKVILTNASGAIQHVTYTDANGNFSFGKLSLQKYMIKLDRHGVDNSSAPQVMLSSSATSKSKLNFVLYPSSLQIDTTTGINAGNEAQFKVGVYPNPFSASIGLEYSLEKASPVAVKVYDATGREIYTGSEGIQTPGRHTMNINDMATMPSGTYILQLNVDGYLIHKNIVKY